MHGSHAHSNDAPLTAAEVLKEEFIQLHGPLPGYHDWLQQLPDIPRLWLFRKDHFKNPKALVEDLLAATAPLTRYLREQLSTETAQSLKDCECAPVLCDSFLQSLADDLNRVIAKGQPLYEKERFASFKLTLETEALVKSAPSGQRLEILNRLLLEEAFPNAVSKVWDTLAGVYALLHTRGRTALCLSGGGIRSATFGLGVLQGLAKRDLLGEFDYLSTVSGGGYIGSWLSSWIHHAGSSQKVFAALKNQTIPSPAEPEPKPLEHLRRFSNYLTPKLGSMSADTWTLVGTYLRNLALNWIVFLPFIIAVLGVPRLGVALLRLPVEAWALTTLLVAGVVFGSIGIAYGAMQRPMLANRLRERSVFWATRRDQLSFLSYCFLPLWLAAVCFTTFWAWLPVIAFELPPWWCFAAGGALLHLCGWMLSVLVIRRASLAEVAGVMLTGAVGGLMLWLPAREAFRNLLEAPDLELYVCFAVPVFLFVFLLTATLFIGLASKRTADADREWWARMGAWLLLGIVAWSAFSALVLFGPLGLLALPPLWNAAGGLPGLFIVLAGYSNSTPPNKEESAQLDWKGRLMNWGMGLAAPLFIVFAIALLSLGATALLKLWPELNGLTHLTLVHGTPVWLAAALILGAGGFGLLMSRLIAINKFSLHSVYRNRLIRAYLGASNPKRDPNPFTGFDPRDNLCLSLLAGQRPLHVVNMALNLVSDDNLAWQQRKAETFSASPLHSGNYRLGYRRSREYAQNEKQHGLSLGTAITISGAAASPNMGYHSSPTVAALMTLFNVRLGAWLGNPGPAGSAVFRKSSPGNAALHVAMEAFGLTDDDNPYVYLSDGGHFENLGLYEMVLRRCHFIVVSDAGCDPDCHLEDLGNAIRKIRIDLGVPIDMDKFNIHSREPSVAGRHCAIGEIRYDKVDGPHARRGLLLYIKPAITGDEPRDVFNYAQTCSAFPHESTGDQWFSESQFESYRMLGLHTVNEMCQDWDVMRGHFSHVPPLATFARQTYKYLETPWPAGLDQRLFPQIGQTPPAGPERAATIEATTAASTASSAVDPGDEPKSF